MKMKDPIDTILNQYRKDIYAMLPEKALKKAKYEINNLLFKRIALTMLAYVKKP
jgi:hypothetical protein